MDSSEINEEYRAELMEYKELSYLEKVNELIGMIQTQMILNRRGLEEELQSPSKQENVVAAKMFHMKQLYKMTRFIRGQNQSGDRIQRVSRSKPDVTKSPSSQKSYKYKCPLCDFKNLILISVIEHVYRIHQKIYALTCPTCKAAANHTADMVAHLKTHIKTRNFLYVCPFTDQQFTSRCDLRIHIRDTPNYFTLTDEQNSKIKVLIEE